MQSKLPIRIKRRRLDKYRRKCHCDDDESDSDQQNDKKENLQTEKAAHSCSTQTIEAEKQHYTEIKSLLMSINCILEVILQELQGKKEYLYSKLEQEVTIPCKQICSHKNKAEKPKRKTCQQQKKFVYAWPEISKLYYGAPSSINRYLQRAAYTISTSDLLTSKNQNWICTSASRPFSCTEVNYFQTMGAKINRRAFRFSFLHPHSLLTLIGQGDLSRNDKADEGDSLSENQLIEVH